MPPDTHATAQPHIEEDEAERLALEAAVAEARADQGEGVPHEIVREELLRFVEEMRQRIAALAASAPPSPRS